MVTGKEQSGDLLKKKDKDVKNLCKKLPSVKLLVLLLTEIFNILQIRKIPWH